MVTLSVLNLFLIGIYALIIGGEIAKKMSQQTFMKLFYILLFISRINLII